MAKPYALEISKLPQTLRWAGEADVGVLAKAVKCAGLSPLVAVGSGGSLSAAHALVFFHQCLTGHVARVSTPLELAAGPVDIRSAIWLLSAGGGNVDIQSAFKAAVHAEPRQLSILCGKPKSALVQLAAQHPYVDVALHEPPAGKDGFLATNSLLGFVVLLSRAYLEIFNGEKEAWKGINSVLQPLTSSTNEVVVRAKKEAAPLWERPTTVVLHGTASSVGAIDLESKFTEAAIGNLQIADYRNFAHGRHHWLAKHGKSSGVVAFLTPNDKTLAQKTLAHIPKEIPQLRIELSGGPEANQIASLLWALHVTGWAGEARGIDPGQPGVPDFGRKLYHLTLPKTPKVLSSGKLATGDEAAVIRKVGGRMQSIATSNSLSRWLAALNDFRAKLYSATFGAVVLDYDGTIVETRDRFDPPKKAMVEAIERLLRGGVSIGIATGRGASVRRDLQASLARKYWKQVLVGYYNGAEIAALADDASPDGTDKCCDALRSLAKALSEHPELAQIATQTDRKYQITIEPQRPVAENRLWDLVHEVILATDNVGHMVTRSSHSIDVVARGISKRAVIEAISPSTGSKAVLAIGDRGRWPGNDYELLRWPYALSVDEVSVDPETCWNLGQSGQRGPATTIAYLNSLHIQKKTLRFDAGSLG
jgi:hydroxymethylpyrimidine pyrophosphatase-like HAD family hydrolase/fructoselysine-6-P-deglycase FrlB-like protein